MDVLHIAFAIGGLALGWVIRHNQGHPWADAVNDVLLSLKKRKAIDEVHEALTAAKAEPPKK